MRLDTRSDAIIRRYLLGAISEKERVRVEERIMVDDDFFEQVGLLEDELIDQSLKGDLSAADRKRFEDWFLCTADRRQKLRFARALHRYAADAAPVPDPIRHGWQSFAGFFQPLRPALVHALAGGLLVLAIAGPWQYVRMARLESRLATLQAEQQNRKTEEKLPNAPSDGRQALGGPIEKQIRNGEKEVLRSESMQLAMAVPPSFLLSPGALRDSGRPQRVAIPKGATLVRLRLDLSENLFATYKVVLSGEGGEILSLNRLKALESADRITVTLEAPVSALPGGDYKLQLFGTGEPDAVETYTFRVIRK